MIQQSDLTNVELANKHNVNVKTVLLGTVLQKIEAKERQKYADLYLLWFRLW